MIKSRIRYAHLLLAICLMLSLVAGTSGGVRADADPKDIQYVNRIFAGMASLKIAPPLQLAIWEADILNCANKFKPMPDDNTILTSIGNCGKRTLPPSIYLLYVVLYASATVITGVWAEVDVNTGTKARHTGSIEIDNKNMGRLVTNEAGYATLQFYRERGPDTSAFGPGAVVLTFDYIHYVSTGRNDAGYGALVLTDDGCKMYGGFYSNSDPNTLGTLLFARC